MKNFDVKEAKRLLTEVFMTKEISDELGIDKEQIERMVTEDAILQVQKERKENLAMVKAFKERLETMFPSYRFSARLKSLPSIFGKMLRYRTVADVFGIKVIVQSIDECYYFKDWLVKHYNLFDFEDKIINPKANGYRDLKIVVNYSERGHEDCLVEFIVQTPQMYVDSHTIQNHAKVYPWKYHDVIKNLPAEYEYLEF